MKIGIQASTLEKSGYGRWGEDTYKKLKEHGYSCSDFGMSNTESVLYTASREESDAILLHEKKLAEDAGIEISQVHGPWRWPPRDLTPEDRAERMEKMKRSIRMTSVLGCKNWVIHPLMPFGIEDLESGDAEKTWEINVPFMRELLSIAKEYDITICFENMPMRKFSIATPADILRFVREMNDDHFKVCLDTGHVTVFDGLSLADSVYLLKDEIRTLHVHDNKYGFDMHLMPFFGNTEWYSFGKALKDIGFDGSFSLETYPSGKLPTPIFEPMGKCLYEIACEIVK